MPCQTAKSSKSTSKGYMMRITDNIIDINLIIYHRNKPFNFLRWKDQFALQNEGIFPQHYNSLHHQLLTLPHYDYGLWKMGKDKRKFCFRDRKKL